MEEKSKKDIQEYIQINHEYETVHELSENLNIPKYQVRNILKKYDLIPLSPCHKNKVVGEKITTKQESLYNKFSKMLEEERVKESFFERMNECQQKNTTTRIPGIYNQSDSPYGIASEFRGIKIKK